MRLTQSEILIIKETLKTHSPKSEIYLHGSRVDDTSRGGDIDLFFIVEDCSIKTLNKIYIQAELSRKLNEQRVDLIIISKSESESNEFYLKSEKKVL